MNEKDIKAQLLLKINTLIFNHPHHQIDLNSFEGFKSIIENKINHFSWGLLFLHLKTLEKPSLTEIDFEEALSFECFGLSVELLDDFLDQDNPKLHEINREDFIMLYTELLIRGVYPFAQNDVIGNGLSKLLRTLHGEWCDLRPLLKMNFTESDYFSNVIQKSTEFFSFLTHCALGKSPNFNAYETLMKAIAEMTQILNDIHGIYDPTKNDLIRKSPTLPLIKFIESDPDINLSLLKCHSKGFLSTDELVLQIENSGAIEYCHFLLLEYKTFIINHIRTHFSFKKMQPLLAYFKLETWYESFENTH